MVDLAYFLLFIQPVLFSNKVNASLVDTLLSPDITKRAIIAASVVPTAKKNLESKEDQS
jgi:hypothetical protein